MSADYKEDNNFSINSDADIDSSTINPRDSYSGRFCVTSRDSAQRRYFKPAISDESQKSYIRATQKKSVSRQNTDSRIRVGASTNVGANMNISNKVSEDNSNTTVSVNSSRVKTSGLDSLFAPTTDKETNNQGNQQYQANTTFNKYKLDKASPASGNNERIKLDYSNVGDSQSFKKEISYKDSLNQARKSVNANSSAKLVILKPTDFDEVKVICDAIKSNSKLVVCFKNASSGLTDKVFNFALGAASVSSYKVNLVGEKTYFFSKGARLSEEDKLTCFKEGIVFKN